ncbi:putative ATP binding protein SugR [Yersinia massiliensis]|uniref:AAA family ATPase n=1 Tax=Yersinia massiliensis TaxID=419257 RepID=UPI0005E16DF0|nr:AAA family ATPase [Yersinia massiliensis]CNI69975.1 putative ATP binding protein SugR [Yersinia massiliensis]
MREPYRLEGIVLQDVGVFEHTRFDFPPIECAERDEEKAEIHLFTGGNGCGKSTLLYALAAIFQPSDAGTLIRRRFKSQRSAIDFCFAGLAGTYRASPSENAANNVFGETQLTYGDPLNYNIKNSSSSLLISNIGDHYNLSVPYNSKAFDFAAFAYSGQRSPQSNFTLSAIQQITNSPFENALSFDQTIRPGVLTQWIANNRTQAALALAEGMVDEAKRYDLALSRISQFIKVICELDIVFRLQRSPLAVALNIDGQDVNFEVLPDGLKSIICWVADLALRLEAIPWQQQRDIFAQPIILFLDEVDIHLHPKWQRRILPAIQKLLPNAQVFVSTHSPFVVGSVEDAWVYRLPNPQRSICLDNSVAETISPTHSAAGKSYQLILEEVFGIEEQFDIETESLLSEFYQARDTYLQNPQGDTDVMELADKLRVKSEELDTIIEMELRQIARRIQKRPAGV